MARDKSKTFYDKEGNRRGFVQKHFDRDNPARTIYGFGLDNMGDSFRGAMDEEVKTPLGTIGFGYDGDTIYGNINPALYATLFSGNNVDGFAAGLGDKQIRGARVEPNIRGNENPIYELQFGKSGQYPDNLGGFYNEVNTPVGTLGFGTGDRDMFPSVAASFEPADYIQALVKLLGRGR